MMSSSVYRSVILNRLLSKSITQTREHDAPPHLGEELFDHIADRVKRGWAFECFSGEDEFDDDKRKATGNFIRIRDCIKEVDGNDVIFVLLVEHVDFGRTSFPVVDIETYSGRAIEARPKERGATSTHVVCRFPAQGQRDELEYRCAIEYSSSVRRLDIQLLLARQLRRIARKEEWNFIVERRGKRGQALAPQSFKYHAKLELAVDVGRSLKAAASGRTLSQVVLTKRSEKQSIGRPTVVSHMDVLADIEIRISGKEAPVDPKDQKSWLDSVFAHFGAKGYTGKVLYKGPAGKTISGAVDQAVATAIDLMMCPREDIELAAEPPPWREIIDGETADRMKALLRDNRLWERGQR